MTIANNLGLSIEEGEAVYSGYMNAFPKVAEYFKKCKKDAIDNGYVLINSISKAKSFVDFYEDYKAMNSDINSDFWEKYREEKEKDSELFRNVLKPKVREYFKLKGIIERRALNFPIQGSGAQATKLATSKIFEEIMKRGLFKKVKICNLVHDEIVVECPKELEQEVASLVKKSMEDAGNVFCKIVPLQAQPVITTFWEH